MATIKHFGLVFLGLVALTPGGFAQDAQLRYSKRLAEQLVPGRVLKEVARIDTDLIDASPQVLIRSHPIPLEDVGMPKTRKARLLKSVTNWEIPPFPDLPPPLDGATKTGPDVAPKGPRPGAWSDLPVEGPASYSARLRPKLLVSTGAIPAEDMDIPKPFSWTRYDTQDKGLFQLSLYGGTTSFAAEQAFAAIRNAVPERETLEGVGQEAFMGHLARQEAPPEAPAPAAPARRFEEVPVLGSPRPDLLDPGASAASEAPAFQDIPTSFTGPEKPRYEVRVRSPHRPASALLPHYLTLVAYFPDKALTVEMVADERLATPQDLVELALHILGHLRQM